MPTLYHLNIAKTTARGHRRDSDLDSLTSRCAALRTEIASLTTDLTEEHKRSQSVLRVSGDLREPPLFVTP